MFVFQQISNAILVLLLILISFSATSEETIHLDRFNSGAIGKNVSYFQEIDGQRLTLEQAKLRFTQGNVKKSTGSSLTFGLGVPTVWLKTRIYRPAHLDLNYRLAIETPWLDYVDTYIVHNSKTLSAVSGGDGIPYEERPMQYRVFAFETGFEVGYSEIFIRVESKGPMVIPIRLDEVQQAIQRDISTAYEYGLIYGLMFALAAYNFILFIKIRQNEFGLYALYLTGFVFNSLSYTGQLHTIFTPNLGPLYQDWMDISLMITYSVFGLHFARTTLKTKMYAPKLNKFVVWVASSIPIGMLIGALFNNLQISMILAFALNSSFAFLFIIMGFKAVKNNIASANLFFFASVTAASCIGISTSAVAGILPYNDFTFKAIEVGMALEGILLAILLAERFRTAQRDKIIAEENARTDELTSLNNRRGFREAIAPLWQRLRHEKKDVTAVLLDIDKFKSLNDKYGHATGDLVLTHIAKVLDRTARRGDILARWGGEEFILLLPDTNQKEGILLAEKLRVAVSSSAIYYGGETLYITASIGVAGTHDSHINGKNVKAVRLEDLIQLADDALYGAKHGGRDQVFANQLALVNQ
ncbi:diguanylate cyclase [Psychrosphaera sp. 1_MG-2023]|uniref:sensor domain-containing diguanylate cyclase n=1 Tax=Psychrosphaera sp. 1_MG-2023 TaxID=3062643 RepID=UPI0026E29E4A|nr:diguanylate cyclase [Psychrosphaera sp. 1_MG-2023]MDO6719353.1 diguanylate cyclase [Psychrosphaera sp. 1_MG-2023]